jgi:hypothetical protein
MGAACFLLDAVLAFFFFFGFGFGLVGDVPFGIFFAVYMVQTFCGYVHNMFILLVLFEAAVYQALSVSLRKVSENGSLAWNLTLFIKDGARA